MNKNEFLETCKKETSYGDFFYAVYDEFLPWQEFGHMKDYMESEMGWIIAPSINYNDVSNNDFYMVNSIFNNERLARDQWNTSTNVEPFTALASKLYINALMRIKCNFYVSAKEHYIHAPHIDYAYYTVGALFFLSDCDAPTYLADGTEIESKANRILIFNSATPHSSSAPTNVPYRMTINFNYFGRGINPIYLRNRPRSQPTMVSENYPFLDDRLNELKKLQTLNESSN